MAERTTMGHVYRSVNWHLRPYWLTDGIKSNCFVIVTCFVQGQTGLSLCTKTQTVILWPYICSEGWAYSTSWRVWVTGGKSTFCVFLKKRVYLQFSTLNGKESLHYKIGGRLHFCLKGKIKQTTLWSTTLFEENIFCFISKKKKTIKKFLLD